MDLSIHQKGVLSAGLGVFILSFDAMLIRLANAGHWETTTWRGGLVFLCFSLVLLLKRKRPKILSPQTRNLLAPTLFLATMYALNIILFVYSINHTTTANTVVILASSPLFAAVFSYFFLREALSKRTFLTIVISIIGVLVIFADSMQGTHLKGDISALVLAALMGVQLTLFRLYSKVELIPVIALSGLIAAIFSSFFSSPFTLEPDSYIWLFIMGSVQIPVATILLMQATRYLPSPEVSLFLLIETVLGPIWVWLAVGEETPERTLYGGLIILTSIAINSILTLRKGR